MKNVNGILRSVVIIGNCGLSVFGIRVIILLVIVFIIFVLDKILVKILVVNMREIIVNIFLVWEVICFFCCFKFG